MGARGKVGRRVTHRMVLSSYLDTMVLPSGLKATTPTLLECPSNLLFSWPVGMSHTELALLLACLHVPYTTSNGRVRRVTKKRRIHILNYLLTMRIINTDYLALTG